MATPTNDINNTVPLILTDTATQITDAELRYEFEETPAPPASDITYTIRQSTGNGTLFLDDDDSGAFEADNDTVLDNDGTFTQEDIDSGRLFYLHDPATETETDSFLFSVTETTIDPDEDVSEDGFTIADVIAPLAITTEQNLTVSEGTSLLITPNDLSADSFSVDNAEEVVYTLTAAPDFGNLFLDTNENSQLDGDETALAANGTFTQADINDGFLTYLNTSDGETEDSFSVSASQTDDTQDLAPDATADITITVDTPPELSTNQELTVNEGATATITSASLQVTDSVAAAADLTYTVEQTTLEGRIFRDANDNDSVNPGENLANGATFTQANINNGEIKYRQNPSEDTPNGDSFSFTVEDPEGQTIEETGVFSFDINRAPRLQPVPETVTLNLNTVANGDEVDDIDATDPDGDQVTFEITSGNEDGDDEDTDAPFAIDGEGVITIQDADELVGGEEINLTVTVTDSGDASSEVEITLTPNTPPTFDTTEFSAEVALGRGQASVEAGFSVVLDQEQTLLDSVSDPEEDADLEGIRFEITGGGDNDFDDDGVNAFAIDAGTGDIRIEEPGELFEDNRPEPFTLEVTATDQNGAGLSSESPATVTITFNEETNTAPDIPTPDDPFETIAIDDVIIDDPVGAPIEANDPENDPVTFAITGGNNIDPNQNGTNAFGFDPDNPGQLIVTDNDDLDQLIADNGDQDQTVSLTVQATDEPPEEFGPAIPSEEVTFNILVTPPNEPPTFVTQNPEFSVDADPDPNAEVGDPIQATDPEGDTLTFAITSGNETGAFAINNDGNNNGIITVNDAAEIGNDGDVFDLTVEIDDGSNDPVTTGVTVNVSAAPTANIDVDDNGEITGFTDGILLARALVGFGDANLVAGNVFGPGANRTEAADINTFVDQLEANLTVDVDDNGDITGFTDGILLARALVGFGDANLVAGNVFGPGANRTDAADINDFVDQLEASSLS